MGEVAGGLGEVVGRVVEVKKGFGEEVRWVGRVKVIVAGEVEKLGGGVGVGEVGG